jgi:hypothetical protein
MTEWIYEIREIDPTWETQSPGRPPDGIEIIEGILNGMGEMGWELVAFIPPAWAENGKPHPVTPYKFHAVFKQPKE